MQNNIKKGMIWVGAPLLMVGFFMLYLYAYVSINTSAHAEYLDNDVVYAEYEEESVSFDSDIEEDFEELAKEESKTLIFDGTVDSGSAFVADVVVASGEVVDVTAEAEVLTEDVIGDVAEEEPVADAANDVVEEKPVVIESAPVVAEKAPVQEDFDQVAMPEEENVVVENSPAEAKKEVTPVVIRNGKSLELSGGRVAADEPVVADPVIQEVIDYSDYDRAVKLHESALHVEALPYLQWQVENNAANLDARTKLRLSHRALGSKDALEKFYLGLLDRYPDNTAYVVSLGTLYMSEFWDFQKAKVMYEKALELDPGNEAAVYNLELIRQIESDDAS